jgi:hypothetical protein
MRDNPTPGIALHESLGTAASVPASVANTVSKWVFGTSKAAWAVGFIIGLAKAAADALVYHIEITPWYLGKNAQDYSYLHDDILPWIEEKPSANYAVTRATDIGEWVRPPTRTGTG